jgi:hypothetical protein
MLWPVTVTVAAEGKELLGEALPLPVGGNRVVTVE